jgi:plasmid stability protein
MATLNIKNFPDALYRGLQARARRRRRSVAQEVTLMLQEAMAAPAPESLLGLRGLGKELWRDVEPAAHVARERAAWD